MSRIVAPSSARRLAWIFAALAVPAVARASAEHPYDRHPPPTLAWMLTQLVPSPELGLGGPSPAVGMRWQLTPLLYSFGTYRKLSPWRAFVVEPLTRQSGSVELFASPEYFAAPRGEWILRAGVHATFPLVERGEKLALTIGGGGLVGAASAFARPASGGSAASAEIEAGFSVLFGVVGVFVAYAPRLSIAPLTVMLRLRWF